MIRAGSAILAGNCSWLVLFAVELSCKFTWKSCNALTGRSCVSAIGKLAMVFDLTPKKIRYTLQQTGRKDSRCQRLASKRVVSLVRSSLLFLT